ncbi:PVC-type heme-binding CxxCH protein [Bythopirellula polymerisocia]|uniref:FG-GAP repeat protein n=1 Tax=Bythopirellula polymerisocia TaxID=2528003 RepID=A0A5C6CSG9_9BACT|nr:PVC-type heme-binding CxxCH protein [Bythopirellula polymerisocia]TWU26026.1 FG-GAP repeat protein [Bythopirellula polymerisocia]
MAVSKKTLFLFLILFSMPSLASAETAENLPSYKRHQLTDQFLSEGATAVDLNGDGHLDIVSGPYWYAGPEFMDRFEYYPLKAFDIAGYSDNFLAFHYDFNSDGWSDVLVVGFPGAETCWYENPQNKPGHWRRHVVLQITDNESPTFTDVTGDGIPELVCMSGGQIGYAEIPSNDQSQPWHFRAVSPERGYERFTHGLGVGDVNGDGRMDLLEKSGWWEQPNEQNVEKWTFHEVPFSEQGGSQMFAYDFDGDGDNDVVTSLAAHAYGLSWFENIGKGESGDIEFQEHKIMGERPDEYDFGVAFSQLHAIALADIDGDGDQDIVTGKRFWAHGGHDPGGRDPAVLYWFETVRGEGAIKFVPHRIDPNSGVGTQVFVSDISGDELPDIVVGNKKGTFVFTQTSAKSEENVSGISAASDAETGLKNQPDHAHKREAEGEILATADDGRVLNLDFETGDLQDWTAEGNAFQSQPVKGDTVHIRRPELVSGHSGNFWVGTYEVGGDNVQGSLSSVPFTVTHPYASFLIGGGGGKALGVQVVRASDDKVIHHESGYNAEELRPVVVDLNEFQGEKIYLRILDHGVVGWGHVNFDHFRFHDQQPEFPKVAEGDPKPDVYPYAGLPGAEAVAVMKLPEGFKAQLFASEPEVRQPIAMAIDDRGRIWIAEAYEYPIRAPEGKGRDRILIFEDTDGDGKSDKRTVFAEGLNLVSGIELGFGGVWVGAAPYLMFIPDRDGDDRPDGEPEILLDGWAYQDTHETLNTFIWGPDGWLYGCHGVFTHSRVGKPGTPDDQRVPLNAAIWRYHPTRHEFEVFSEGTSNPWGVDFDDHGQAFCTACVIPHLFHMIQGGRYQRQAGQHFNPYIYGDIQTIADHRHYLGDNPHGGNGNSDDAGGGHAHAGAMIYLGDSWPEKYRGRIFMNNIHGQRINTDILKPEGSGFVGSHGPDFLLTGDIASQILNLRYGPDGQAFVIDWYDTNACHHNTVEGHDRSNGRIYKIAYGDDKYAPIDLADRTDLELAELVLKKNDWYVRHGRRLMQERHAAKGVSKPARDRLSEIATSNPDATRRLRAMWALHVTGGITGDLLSSSIIDKDEHVRAWTIQLVLEENSPELKAELLPEMARMAQDDPSPVVRLYIASALQDRVPLESRWSILESLLAHSLDANDHNLPLMYWYAAEPLAKVDPARAFALGLSCGKTIPLVRKFMIQRIASGGSQAALVLLLDRIIESEDQEEHAEIIRGIREALQGRRQVAPPQNWPAAFAKLRSSDNEDLLSQALALGVTFGDQEAMNAFRVIVGDPKASLGDRRQALDALLRAKDLKLPQVLLASLSEPALRESALLGLALYDDPSVPKSVLDIYDELSPSEKRAALATLCSRTAYGLELLKAIQAKQVPTADVPADLIRQLQNLKNSELDSLLANTWGQVRSTPEDKAKLIAELCSLVANPPSAPDPEMGRAIFAKTCQQCHTLYGVGAQIGPDLTGSNRSDLDYLLTNIVDPSSVITKDYQQTIVLTDDGLVVSGLVKAEDDNSVTIQTTTNVVVIPKNEIEDRYLSEQSMMPDDQLKQFSPSEIVSLLTYLAAREQVPVLATEENQELFFNGKDLSGWSGDERLWSVESSEIVGRSTGLEKNAFLFSEMSVDNFELTFEVKLIDDEGNSGVQFRSQAMQDGEARGYQADIGPGWWGKLYEENGREVLWGESRDDFVKKGDWNQYRIVANGGHIQTWINDKPCVDLNDPSGARRGVIALQLHSGGPMEVRFRKIRLKVL